MSRPGSPVLRLEGVTKTYGSGQDRLRVLDGVDLELRRGETTSMIGRSGSGKSTLIALAAGLLRPDAGRIHIGGQRTDELDDDARSSLPRCSRCCSRPIRRPSWPTRYRADELTGPVAGHSQNTQYHTGYILGRC